MASSNPPRWRIRIATNAGSDHLFVLDPDTQVSAVRAAVAAAYVKHYAPASTAAPTCLRLELPLSGGSGAEPAGRLCLTDEDALADVLGPDGPPPLTAGPALWAHLAGVESVEAPPPPPPAAVALLEGPPTVPRRGVRRPREEAEGEAGEAAAAPTPAPAPPPAAAATPTGRPSPPAPPPPAKKARRAEKVKPAAPAVPTPGAAAAPPPPPPAATPAASNQPPPHPLPPTTADKEASPPHAAGGARGRQRSASKTASPSSSTDGSGSTSSTSSSEGDGGGGDSSTSSGTSATSSSSGSEDSGSESDSEGKGGTPAPPAAPAPPPPPPPSRDHPAAVVERDREALDRVRASGGGLRSLLAMASGTVNVGGGEGAAGTAAAPPPALTPAPPHAPRPAAAAAASPAPPAGPLPFGLLPHTAYPTQTAFKNGVRDAVAAALNADRVAAGEKAVRPNVLFTGAPRPPWWPADLAWDRKKFSDSKTAHRRVYDLLVRTGAGGGATAADRNGRG